MRVDNKFQRILVENGMVALPQQGDNTPCAEEIVTILGNITYYGFALSETAIKSLITSDRDQFVKWWKTLEMVFKTITGDDKNMGDFVVYKNFPREVLDMDEADYWSRQILMYWGLPNELFTEKEDDREKVVEKLPVKLLHPAGDNSLEGIFSSLLRLSVRWTDRQWETVSDLASLFSTVDISGINFKENMVKLATLLMKNGTNVTVKTATDVLRLAVGLSDGDESLRTNSKFRKFSRPERKFLLSLLEGCRNIDEDVARRKGQFKRLLFGLHPGDYRNRYKKVVATYNKLYRGERFETFNSKIEELLGTSNPEALDLLKTRPGEFVRRLRVALSKYGNNAVEAFGEVIPKLSVHQLLKIERHLLTVNDRKFRAFPPKGNWTKLKVVNNTHRLDDGWVLKLSDMIVEEVSSRVAEVVESVRLSEDTENIKLQTSDSDLMPYGRGTAFNIPENIKFLRSASYWQTEGISCSTWFDNGWNFFDENWKNMGTCCWTSTMYGGKAAVFSGDSTNSKEMDGRACQMIDLYIDKLRDMGVRYAVWNVLCYSNISFDSADDVFAALQWGEKAQKNKTFEPSRCVFSFPLKGSNMTKYIAYIDTVERKLVYMDANLYGNVSTADSNRTILENTMPAFVEYLNSLPSVYDLFKNVYQNDSGIPVLLTDEDEKIDSDMAYVFQQRNKDNTFNQLDLNALLEL
jgi:hypothetical protein